MTTAFNALRNAGVPVSDRYSHGYNHVDLQNEWKIVTDPSVRGTASGGECVSPILSGVEGLEQVEKVAKALSAAGATANRSCGLHVHVDARTLNAPDVANVLFRYAKFEQDIDRVMPRSRRNGGQGYCDSITRIVDRNRTRIANSRTVNELVRNSGLHRMVKVNVHAFVAHGSIEFRHHSGTVNADKITNWIKFCVNFVETSRVAPTSSFARTNSNSRRGRPSGKKLRTLQAIVVQLNQILPYRRRSAARIASEVGISEGSVVSYISVLRREYGFVIKKDRFYNSYRIVRNGSFEPTSAPNNSASTRPTFEIPASDNAFWGLPRSVVAFYEERRADLAG